MIRRLPLAVLCALALLAPVLAGTASTATADSARHHYPVQWDFLVNAFQANAGRGPNDPPPGSDLPCHPSKAHPRPVVLVHGLAADQSDNWLALAPFLANHGYCVFSLTYGNNASGPGFSNRMGGFADMRQSAHQLARFVHHVLHVTRAKKVDLVGHSEGGTMPDWYLKFDRGYRHVAHYVDLSGVLHGTTMWGVANLYTLGQAFGYSGSPAGFDAYCASCTQFLPSSAWMKKLDAPHPVATRRVAATCRVDGAAVDGVKYTSIGTRNDELVRPPTSDFIKPACETRKTGIGVHNIVIQHVCPQDQSDHLSIVSDPNVGRLTLNALDPAHAQHVHCQAVLPAIG
jgi:triacylglycerol esterase/lipase EstA (alpha/beta hydrolase family)